MTTNFQAPGFTLRPARIAARDGDESGVLVFVGDYIVGIVVRLEAPFYGENVGSWYLEIGFGACEGSPDPFSTLSEALVWIAGRLGIETLVDDLAEAERIFSRGGQDAHHRYGR